MSFFNHQKISENDQNYFKNDNYMENVYKTVFPFIKNSEIGEIFIESTTISSLSINNQIVSPSFNSYEGFGLRQINDEIVNFSYSDDISIDNIKKFCNNTSSIISMPGFVRGCLYQPTILMPDISEQLKLIKEIDSYLRSDSIVKNSQIVFKHEQQDVFIINNLGRVVVDNRPIVTVQMRISVASDAKQDSVYSAYRNRLDFSVFLSSWKELADDLLKRGHVALKAQPAPGGIFPVVISNEGGVWLHEACGHCLEADAITKQTSILFDKMGDRLAIDDVTIVDSGILQHGNIGSIHFDDEGMESREVIAVKNGILTNFLCDRFYGRAYNSSGNGKRMTYADLPYPRMTNTYMLNGKNKPEDLVKDVSKGIYIKSFGGGSVNTVNGSFAFEVKEAYTIIDGEIKDPVSDCAVSGKTVESLQKIVAVGNDLNLCDNKGGLCGKNGQWVPVTDGMPSILVKDMNIGGTNQNF